MGVVNKLQDEADPSLTRIPCFCCHRGRGQAAVRPRSNLRERDRSDFQHCLWARLQGKTSRGLLLWMPVCWPVQHRKEEEVSPGHAVLHKQQPGSWWRLRPLHSGFSSQQEGIELLAINQTQNVPAIHEVKTSPQAKRHELSLQVTFKTIFTFF